MRRAGLPIHDMVVRVTIDRKFNVVDALARVRRGALSRRLRHHRPGLQKLIGLNLVKKFRDAVKERLGGVQGCTHITEMLAGLPTAAIQTFAGEMREERAAGQEAVPARPLPRAWTRAATTVQKWYPEWYAAKEKAGA